MNSTSFKFLPLLHLPFPTVILKLSNEPIPKGLKEVGDHVLSLSTIHFVHSNNDAFFQDLTPEELKLIIDFLKKRLTKVLCLEH